MRKILRIVVLLCLIASCVVFVSCDKDNRKQKTYEMNPVFDIQIDIDSKTVSAIVSMDFTSQIDSDRIIMQYYPLRFGETVTDVEEITVNQTKADYNLSKEISAITVNHSVKAGERTNATVKYELTLPNCADRLGFVENYYSLCRFYPYVAPIVDGDYSARAYCENGETELFYTANFDVTIRISDKFVVAHTGNSYEINTENGLKTYEIKADGVRDFAIAYSKNFTMRKTDCNGVSINYYFLNDATPNFELEVTEKALTTFEKLFGAYGRQKLSLVIAPFVNGGMEYSELIVVNDQLKDAAREETIAHEVAHQWWFMKVGNDQAREPWIDESLAEFSAALYFLETDRGQTFESIRKYGMKTLQNRTIDKKPCNIRGSVYEFDDKAYSDCVYTIGCLMWINLYSVKGPTLINDLAKYVETYSGKIATETDVSSAAFSGYESMLVAWLDGKVIV